MTNTLLYLISPPVIPDVALFRNQLAAALDAGGEYVGAFQLRLKQPGAAEAGQLTDPSADSDTIKRAADLLLPVCRNASVPFILNDNPALAAEIGADGVHLGQEDVAIAEARALMGEEAVIGMSCHASKHLAMDAGEQGADYVAFGAFYPTASKSPEALAHWGTPEPEILAWWTTHVVLPCVAIGGITPANAAPLVEAGADFIAALSSVWNHPDSPAVAVEEFVAILKG